MAPTIVLTDGSSVLVDEDTYGWASAHKWWPGGYRHRYAVRFVARGESVRTIYLHRAIMGEPPRDGLQVDHIDGDARNCQRSNMRWVTPFENTHNQSGPQSNSSTGVRHVYFVRKTGRFRVSMCVAGKTHHFRSYPSMAEAGAVAARVYRDLVAQALRRQGVAP